MESDRHRFPVSIGKNAEFHVTSCCMLNCLTVAMSTTIQIKCGGGDIDYKSLMDIFDMQRLRNFFKTWYLITHSTSNIVLNYFCRWKFNGSLAYFNDRVCIICLKNSKGYHEALYLNANKQIIERYVTQHNAEQNMLYALSRLVKDFVSIVYLIVVETETFCK